jgi:Zn-dependent protease
MAAEQLIPIPFLLDYRNLEVDKCIIFVVAMLMAVTVNAEGQAIMATTLGDIQKDSKKRFHFNPLLHLDIAGTLCFVIAGFGWPRPISIEQKKFKYPNVYLIVSRFAGPMANLLLAGFAGSIIWILHIVGVQDQVFTIILSVNLMVFVFNFIPLPPLAAASLFCPLLPNRKPHLFKMLAKIFPFLLVLFFLFLRFSHIEKINSIFFPIVRSLSTFITG